MAEAKEASSISRSALGVPLSPHAIDPTLSKERSALRLFWIGGLTCPPLHLLRFNGAASHVRDL